MRERQGQRAPITGTGQRRNAGTSHFARPLSPAERILELQGKIGNRDTEQLLKSGQLTPEVQAVFFHCQSQEEDQNQFVETCEDRMTVVREAHDEAVSMLGKAIALLDQNSGIDLGEGHRVGELLDKHFHSQSQETINDVKENLTTILEDFESNTYICIGTCEGDRRAEITRRTISILWWTIELYLLPIRICDRFFEETILERRAAFLIHEAAHVHLKISDVEYLCDIQDPNCQYQYLTTEQALENPDSYAWFVYDAVRQ